MTRRFLKYYRPYIGEFILDLLAAAVVAGCSLGLPIVTRAILNTYIGDRDLKMVLVLGGALLIAYLVKVFCNRFMAYQGHVTGAKIQADMRRDLFSKMQHLTCTFFDNNKTGSLMSRMTNDLFDVAELAHHGPEDLIISVVQFGGAIVIMATINLPLSLVAMVVVFCMVFFVSKLRHRLSETSRNSRAKIAELNAGLENSISGIRVSRTFNATAQEEDKFASYNGDYVQTRSHFYAAMGTFHSWMSFATDFLYLVVLTLGGVLVICGRGIAAFDYVDLVTFMLYISVITQPIVKMVGFTEQYESGMTGFSRFCEIMDSEEEEEDPEAKEAPAFKGEITFQGVNFSYSEGGEVLHDMSFTVGAGQTVALVGSSGGGKTTVCHLIPRLYEIASGSISIDGMDIRQMTRSSLREQIGMVAQDVFLFNATIYENIAYGTPGATREMVEEAARRAKLEEFILSLPQGYETQVGERGVKLSGGQKQRVAIARVFLKNPPILILDEATSALDNITEHQIQESLAELCRGRTTLVVAHRLSTVRSSDNIMYIEDGRIAEQGTHEELLAQKGEYARLAQATEALAALN